MSIIEVNSLCKNYKRKHIEPGLRGHIKAFFFPDITNTLAVDDCSFSVNKGEKIAFLGPNGAGKSTVIKVLTGIITRTSGEVKVLGLDPQKKQKELSKQIGFIFGQRSQLQMYLPARDSLRLLGTMYDVPSRIIEAKIQELAKELDVKQLLSVPVRMLSLGERIRFELMGAMIHEPKILFLDEPTIGLDIVAKHTIINNIREFANSHGTTVFMTSHDPGDIDKLCDRSIIIDSGHIIVDESIVSLKERYNITRKINVMLADSYEFPDIDGVSVQYSDCKAELDVDTTRISISDVIRFLAAVPCIKDIQIVNNTIEDILSDLYNK